MSTFSKRATPSQAFILRIIEGAVLNAADAHGEPRNHQQARSIAKRAAGTLSAQWTDVLAAKPRLSDQGTATATLCRACERRAQLNKRAVRQQRCHNGVMAKLERGASHLPKRRSPLLLLWKQLASEMWQIKRSGDTARLAAYCDLLRMIDKLRHKLHEERS